MSMNCFTYYIFFFVLLLRNFQCLNRELHSLTQIARNFPLMISNYQKYPELGFNLSDNIYISLQNITSFFLYDNPILNEVVKTITYQNLNITFMYKVKIDSKPIEEDLYSKNIAFYIERGMGNIHFPEYQLYNQIDNSFNFNESFQHDYIDIDIKELKQFELFNTLYQEKGVPIIRDLLLGAFKEAMVVSLVTYPVCDSMFLNNQMLNHIRSRGTIKVNHPDEPSFKSVTFKGATWTKVSKINLSVLEFDYYKVSISYVRSTPFTRTVFFDKIQISPSSITMKDFYPEDPVLEDIMRDIFNKAFDHILSLYSNDK